MNVDRMIELGESQGVSLAWHEEKELVIYNSVIPHYAFPKNN
jgi:hypothetical protein